MYYNYKYINFQSLYNRNIIEYFDYQNIDLSIYNKFNFIIKHVNASQYNFTILWVEHFHLLMVDQDNNCHYLNYLNYILD